MKANLIKVVLIGAIALVLLSSGTVLFTGQKYAVATTVGLYPGIQGSINGKPVCHCPDDLRTCYCQI